MDSDKTDEKRDVRERGDTWSDVKEEWEEQWIEDNWDAETEAAFLVAFENQWFKDHGTPFPAEQLEAA